MEKVLNLNLDYELVIELSQNEKERLSKEEQEKLLEKRKKNAPSPATITRNIIDNAYPQNHQTMNGKVSRQWRSVVKQMEEVLKAKKVFVVFSQNDFDSVYDEVYKSEYPPQQAFIVPILLDELDRVRNRSQKEETEILENMEQIDKASGQVKKVLEMSEVKK